MNKFEKSLKQGSYFTFTNGKTFFEGYVYTVCKFCIDSKNEYMKGFQIFFNGAMVHASMDFKSFEEKLNKLKLDWNLELKK